ncbi:hypothetical protein TNIN_469071 [Trichonephila inaurata madagascariensis]|uniref:Uncharacterized protein n=1 Tax=Trichonephila inaurata madagascariensis TaxID=2747483 RepID=A0A8X7BRP9_9ARAC|nr:hypothetical protein TNIN_469071 [Trichonephila inaurata madagascariensis]
MIARNISLKTHLRIYDTIGHTEAYKPGWSRQVRLGLRADWTVACYPPPRVRKLLEEASTQSYGYLKKAFLVSVANSTRIRVNHFLI